MSAGIIVKRRLSETEYGDVPVWSEYDVRSDMTADEWSDGAFFSSVAVLRRHCREDGEPVPVEVHGCIRRPFELSADSVLESALVEHYEEAAFSKEAEAELQTLLDAWVAKHGGQVETWEHDASTIVVLDKEPAQ